MKVRIRWWWSLVILGAGLLMVASFYGDASVQSWIADHQDAGTRKFMRGVGQFGDWPGHVTLGLVLLVLAFWRRSKKWMRIFAAMILACALAGAGARVVKIAVGRPRPAVESEAGWKGPSLSARNNSLPSGHTAASTAFFATLAFACWRIGLPLMIVPLLIGVSRVYVNAHYLSDVVCAALIGLISAFAISQWLLSEIPVDSDRTKSRK
jgi:membrane-associated phospholipid phosphatase